MKNKVENEPSNNENHDGFFHCSTKITIFYVFSFSLSARFDGRTLLNERKGVWESLIDNIHIIIFPSAKQRYKISTISPKCLLPTPIVFRVFIQQICAKSIDSLSHGYRKYSNFFSLAATKGHLLFYASFIAFLWRIKETTTTLTTKRNDSKDDLEGEKKMDERKLHT